MNGCKPVMSHKFHNLDCSVELNGPSAKRFKMNNPDTQNNTFLFTSESVGEGHPGKLPSSAWILIFFVAPICITHVKTAVAI